MGTFIVTAIMTVFAFWFGNRVGEAFIVGGYNFDSLDGLANLSELPVVLLKLIKEDPLSISTEQIPMILGALLACAAVLGGLGVFQSRLKNTRAGEEHGSARWAKPRELKPFRDWQNPDPYNHVILSENSGLAISRNKFNLEYDRNLNILLIGGPGSGKTRYFVKPNLMQLNSIYFVTDPKGTLLEETGWMFRDAGYEISSFNTADPSRSLHFNMLAYVKTDDEVLQFAENFIEMTTDLAKKGGDDFWPKAERLLLITSIALLRDYYPPEDYDFDHVMTLISMAKAKEEDENFKSDFDKIFDELITGYRPVAAGGGGKGSRRGVARPKRERSRKYNRRTGQRAGHIDPNDLAIYNYKQYKNAAGKTAKSILVSIGARLSPLTPEPVREIIKGPDDMHLEEFGRKGKKRIIFATFDDMNSSLGFLHGILCYTALNAVVKTADREFHGKLPVPVHFILDEYRSLNLPANIAQKISVIRSRNVSMSIIVQSPSQMKEIYDEPTMNSIMDNCATTIYLGGGKADTCKMISDMLGQQTVTSTTSSTNHGGQGSWSQSTQLIARPLMDPAEVGRLEGTKEIVMIYGARPLLDLKYKITEHPRYEYIDPGHKAVWKLRSPFYRNVQGRRRIRLPLARVKARYDEPFDVMKYREGKQAQALKEVDST